MFGKPKIRETIAIATHNDSLAAADGVGLQPTGGTEETLQGCFDKALRASLTPGFIANYGKQQQSQVCC